MRKFFVSTCFVVFSCTSLLADTASKDAKINEFLSLINAAGLQEQIYSQLGGQIDRAAMGLAQQARIPAAEQLSATADLRGKMTAAMKDAVSWEKLKPGMLKIYEDAYSEADLDAMLAFFRSPAGKLYISKSPGVAADARKMTEGLVRDLAGSFQEMGKAWADAHRLAGAPPATTPAPPPAAPPAAPPATPAAPK
jgi:uncharacterized protein